MQQNDKTLADGYMAACCWISSRDAISTRAASSISASAGASAAAPSTALAGNGRIDSMIDSASRECAPQAAPLLAMQPARCRGESTGVTAWRESSACRPDLSRVLAPLTGVPVALVVAPAAAAADFGGHPGPGPGGGRGMLIYKALNGGQAAAGVMGIKKIKSRAFMARICSGIKGRHTTLLTDMHAALARAQPDGGGRQPAAAARHRRREDKHPRACTLRGSTAGCARQ